jgi:predicted dinucleotide-binding enzyme
MKIGIIGSGSVAQAIGSGLIALGHEVTIGSRDAAKPAIGRWLEKSGPAAHAGTFAEAAKYGEMIFVATKGTATEHALQMANPHYFAGKVVVDVTNPLTMNSEKQLTLAALPDGSLGEAVQRVLPDAKVVKTLNTVNSAHMVHPQFAGGTPEMFLCGNDADAKALVGEILVAFGWKPVDAGKIDSARLLEPLSMLGIRLALGSGNWNYVFRLIHQDK